MGFPWQAEGLVHLEIALCRRKGQGDPPTCRTMGLGFSSQGFSDEVGSSQGSQRHSNSPESLKYVSYGKCSISLKVFCKAQQKGGLGEKSLVSVSWKETMELRGSCPDLPSKGRKGYPNECPYPFQKSFQQDPWGMRVGWPRPDA